MKKLKSNTEMKGFFNEMEAKGSIDPKDAFFGGRTCVHRIYAKADGEYEIIYVDIISLYPFINFEHSYPIKMPEIVQPEHPIVDWTQPEQIEFDGLYKVRVVPPRQLFLPVLPMRVNKEDPRLMFMLCQKCAITKSKKATVVHGPLKCNHSDEQRGWTSTMTSIELRAALREGYRIDRCYRIWKYQEFDNLFKEYVQTFMKMKIESSGFPSNVQTPEEKSGWAKEYRERLGIQIDLSAVQMNSGLRYISKLLLNSLWGKFGQRNNLTKSLIIRTPADYFQLVLSSKMDIRQILPVSDGMMRVTYLDRESLVKESNTSNVVVALSTTSAARLKLYEYMRMVQQSPGCDICYTGVCLLQKLR
jgi:hypothetical protein